jgi:hypothetical protein
MNMRAHLTYSLLAITVAMVLALGACTRASDHGVPATADPASVADDSEIPAPEEERSIAAMPSSEEIQDLLWVREEEKLAHDVYVALHDQWQLTVFDNISRAETQHTQAIALLLDRYGVDDPAAGLEVGVFSNPELQQLYEELVERGSRSMVEALEVGAYIEEMDILDLRARETAVTEIQETYDRLERGSQNHLRAFVRNLERRDGSYEPVLLAAEAFNQILEATAEGGGVQSSGSADAGRGPRWQRGDS